MIVRKIQERKATSGGKRLGHKPRSAHEDQPNWCRIPEEFQVPRLHECAACGVPSFCCAGLFAWRIYLRLLEISNLLTYLRASSKAKKNAFCMIVVFFLLLLRLAPVGLIVHKLASQF